MKLPTKEQYEAYKKIQIQEYSEPKYQCPECKNGGMCRDESTIFLSFPAMNKYKCNRCGYVDFL